MSPYTVIIRRSGNPFELAHMCVSWLIGAGYDAYVVVGCAERDVCMAIRYRTTCPDLPDETEKVEEEGPPEEEPKYRLVPLPDLTSKYCEEMDLKDAAKKQAEWEKQEAERLRKIAELEQPPPDEINGWRTHAWVIVLPGSAGVEEPFFIEPSEGNDHPLNAKQYQYLDCIYNHENYYVMCLDVAVSCMSWLFSSPCVVVGTSGDKNQRLRVYNVSCGREVPVDGLAVNGTVTAITVTHSGSCRIAAGDCNRKLRLWDLPTRRGRILAEEQF